MYFRPYYCKMRRSLLLFIILLSVTNIVVFLFRDHFHYQPYAGYSQLYGACNAECEKKWKQFADDYPAKDLSEAGKITDSITAGKIHTLNKALAIGSYLYNRFSQQSGRPSEMLLKASPLDQYKTLCASSSEKLWCGNFAQMFAFFCWSQNIVTRNVEIMYPGDRHVLNECYIPEMGSWIMIDVTNNLLLIRNNVGEFLNLVQFSEAIRKKTPLSFLKPDSITAMKMETLSEKLVPKQYFSKHPIYYYHRVDNQKAYSAGEKLKRYFLPVSWYDIFDNNKKRSNLAFYLKGILIFLWMVSVIIFLMSRSKSRT